MVAVADGVEMTAAVEVVAGETTAGMVMAAMMGDADEAEAETMGQPEAATTTRAITAGQMTALGQGPGIRISTKPGHALAAPMISSRCDGFAGVARMMQIFWMTTEDA
ncbi:hypothetical protein [Microvirga sp. VF16]|uniref:hypothetical protein n=1 Tax=Microvirga sp. VF16 TaxID=2807101 RepID=UPI00193E4797|nr:hypothetical protein [Microvirga sp. VF16]QRM30300.1 hypothetical protein JO965_04590 [Microvirga sp. VF16]